MLYKIFSYNSFLVDEALKRMVYTHMEKIRRESKEWYKLPMVSEPLLCDRKSQSLITK